MNFKNTWLVGLVSAALIAATTRFEGTRYVPYRDVADVWTVCDGYAGKDIIRGKTYTPVECTALLKTQLKSKGEEVLKCTNVPLNENQFNAFTLFAYNVGGEAYCRSSLLKNLNAGDYTSACNGLLVWDMADGKVIPGLLARRKFERDWCLRPVVAEAAK